MFRDTLTKFIAQAEEGRLTTADYPRDWDGLELKVSFGMGALARVPWMAFLEPGTAVSNGINPVFLYYKDARTLILAYGISEEAAPERQWPNELVQDKQTINDYLGGGASRYGNSYVNKAYSVDTSDGIKLLERDGHEEASFDAIEQELASMIAQYKNIIASTDGIPGDLRPLFNRVRKFMDDNPDWRDNPNWQLRHEEIVGAITEFNEKFHPDKLSQLSDEEILRWIPYRQESTHDSLSYVLEFSPIIGKIGGIRGGSAGKMGYYQGQDGQWKKFQSNGVTTREDVLLHRKIDIDILCDMYTFIVEDDWGGLSRYINDIKNDAYEDTDNNIPTSESITRYKAIVPGLVWVRKYFSILFIDKFIEIYGDSFVRKLEPIAELGPINAGVEWDYSLWYSQMNKIASMAPKLGITTYELSRIVWDLINQQETGEQKSMDEGVEVNATSHGLNTIIYGPPGTGKTYSIQSYKNQLLSNQQSKFEHHIKGSVKDTLLFIFTHNNNYPQRPLDIWRSEKFQQLQEYNGRTKSNGSAIRNELAYDTALFERVEEDGIKYRATQEGLEYLQSIVDAQAAEPTTSLDEFYNFITFHQSYGYEEFIEGIRAETGDNGNVRYVVRDGVFKSFCRRAESDPENNYLFVIDEINRGNISKIFGELITLIEPNKRLGASEALESTLPYSGEKFGVPKNVYIIGTMNTADRSIALLDIALRRRFDFKEILPNPSLLSSDLEGINLQQLLATINTRVVEEIDRNHQIGHSYLMGVNNLSDLHYVWYQRIVPLLQEYFYNDNDDLRGILKTFVDKDEIVLLSGDDFKRALVGIYEDAQSPDTGIQI